MILANAQATHEAGLALAPHMRVGDVIALSGDLGAGKSTFARGLLEGLGFEGDVPSPTFALVIPYSPPALRLPVWHVDLYRIEGAEEAAELGLEDALDEGALVIEWPERLGDRLWPGALRLRFEPHGQGRLLTASVPPSWEARCPLT